MTRRQLSSTVLILLTGVGVVACAAVAVPFLPALTWALAVAVAADPFRNWIFARIPKPEIAAGICVVSVAICLLVPAVLIAMQVFKELTEQLEWALEMIKSGEWERQLASHPEMARLLGWIRNNFNVEQEIGNLMKGIQDRLRMWVSGTVWAAIQFAVMLFTLFYLFRDRDRAIAGVRWILPLSDHEADTTLDRVRAIVHATIFGSFTVAAIQGTLGGLMFWMVGFSKPLLMGVVMGLLALIPSLGTFMVWLPAAAAMALQGHWGKAVFIALWGFFVVASIDNILYPMLVGKEMHIHSLIVFVATLGGLALFGAPGLILGPLFFAVTLALLEVLRRRTVANRPVQQPT